MQAQDPRVERRVAFTNRFRSSVDDSIRDHDPALWNRARMFVRSLTNRYTNSEHAMAVTELDLHDLWYLILGTAKITPVKDPAGDQLVAQVIIARQLGQVHRLVSDDHEQNDLDMPNAARNSRVEDAVTTSGERMWTDLPFLVTDLRAMWAQTIHQMSMSERESLANFSARLSATGVCDPHVTSCALILFREALETPRRILPTDATSAGDNVTPLVDFLPAICVWLWHGSFQIFKLCARSYVPPSTNDFDPVWAATESITGREDSTERPPGFSMERWYCWKSRLEEVRQTPDDAIVAEQGRLAVHLMESWEEITGGRTHERARARNAFFHGRTA